MTVEELIALLFPDGSKITPTDDQLEIVCHTEGPGWVLAGPGSGKTETLALFVLRLLYVENDACQKSKVPPTSIFATTFTEKAARNLEDRISRYRAMIVEAKPELAVIDVSKLRIGTLHGLCNDILQEERAPGYQNVRLMDELESALFVYQNCSLVNAPNSTADLSFWSHFDYLFRPDEWQSHYTNLPNKWSRTLALIQLFDRIVENRADLNAMKAKGGSWSKLADAYEEFLQALERDNRCDFAHLQLKFLEFLKSPLGARFSQGDPTADDEPGVAWVVVDEYQDTNLMQEEIYLTLAAAKSGNVLVVGDDDQAMYRFRGGSVECMVSFDQACAIYLADYNNAVSTYPLVENFRSHADIVSFCDEFITAFPALTTPGARVPGKKGLVPKSSISGDYPAVGVLRGQSVAKVVERFAELVFDLKQTGIVNDYSQCCLLLKSTRESPNNAGKYAEALRAKGIPVYNPRNRGFLEQEEVLSLLGALIALLDPNGAERPTYAGQSHISDLIGDALDAYQQNTAATPEIRDYVDRSNAILKKYPGRKLNSGLQELIYYLLAFEPFRNWLVDPARRLRLGKITQLIESYASIPIPEFPDLSQGDLKASDNGTGGVNEHWIRAFYNRLFGYISRSDKGLNDVEDERVIVPQGYFPVMTMHQSKGLEFPFVFVGHMGETAGVRKVHQLETAFDQFPGNSARVFQRPSESVRAELDVIRQYFVAFSRAEWSLMLVGSNSQLNKENGIPSGPGKTWLKARVKPI